MSRSGRPAALFDIDGTLVDSNYLHIEAWGKAFAAAELPVDQWRVHRAIGMDSSKLLAELVGQSVADARSDELKDAHTGYYRELAPRLRTFAGAEDLLRRLTERGAQVVLATSAPAAELELIGGVLDIEGLAAAVTSAEDVTDAKPEPDIVEVALRRADVDPANAVFIGDSVWDVIAAGKVGVAAIGVLSGGYSEAELTDAGAVAVYSGVADLLEHLDESPLAGLLDSGA